MKILPTFQIHQQQSSRCTCRNRSFYWSLRRAFPPIRRDSSVGLAWAVLLEQDYIQCAQMLVDGTRGSSAEKLGRLS